jgi:hypothetical protein
MEQNQSVEAPSLTASLLLQGGKSLTDKLRGEHIAFTMLWAILTIPRTHRERKEQYIKQMESELMLIKEAYHKALRDRDQAQAESKKLKDILEASGVTYVLDMSSPETATATTPGNDPSSSGSFSGSYRTPTSSTSGTQSPPPRRDPQHHHNHTHNHDDRPSRVRTPNQTVNPSQAGIDFVLAYDNRQNPHSRPVPPQNS